MDTSLESAILSALYERARSRPGAPQMTLGELYSAIGASPGDQEKIQYQLLSLREKGWVRYQILEDGSGGEVEITPDGIKVARDLLPVSPGAARVSSPERPRKASRPSRNVPPKQTQSTTDWPRLILRGGLGLLAGVLGNLIAAWIQQVVLGNVFTPPRVTVVLLMAVVVLIAEVWIQRRPSKLGIVVIVMLVLLAAFIPVVWRGESTPAPEEGTFYYAVQVQARDTGEEIPYAAITIDGGGGKAPVSSITDANGFAMIRVDASYLGQPARLIVEATRYEKYTQYINLTRDDLSQVVQLDPTP